MKPLIWFCGPPINCLFFIFLIYLLLSNTPTNKFHFAVICRRSELAHWLFYRLDGHLETKETFDFYLQSSDKVCICLVLGFGNDKVIGFVVFLVLMSFKIKCFWNDFKHLQKINQEMLNERFLPKIVMVKRVKQLQYKLKISKSIL